MTLRDLTRAALGAVVLFVGACAGLEMRGASGGGSSASDLGRLAASRNPPKLTARTAVEIADAAATAGGFSAERLEARGRVRMLEVSAIPYLRSSPEGAAFLGASFPRALARGEPPARCGGAAAAAGVDGSSATLTDAASAALGACVARLEAREAPADCACRVVAVDDALLAPRENFSFAPGVSALLIGERVGAIQLVAESLRPIDGAELVSLRDLDGEVARLILLNEEAELVLLDEPDLRWGGERTIFGYRRGRLAERVRFEAEDGDRLTLLIGVEERDVLSP